MPVEDELKKLATNLATFKEKAAQLEKIGAQLSEAIKGYVPIEFLAEGAIKSYKEAVSKTDGLTSIKPSVIKALDGVNVRPTKAGVQACKKALDDHLGEVQKAQSAAKDDKVKKRVEEFKKNLEAVKVHLDKQKTVG